ncbi:MAG: adenylyltransferase/cytidyltransferase family protein [Patescibacteria group bacterium]
MPITAGIFGAGSSFDDRYIPDYAQLGKLVESWKTIGLKIVLTSGSFDMFHEGHALYLEAAKKLGDLLIVGVDSDEKIRAKKGPNRPGVPQIERLRILAHVRHVDVVTLKNLNDSKWALIKLAHPDVLQATEDTYTDEQIEELRAYCGEVVVQKRMATTSTSARIRLLVLTGAEQISKTLIAELPGTVQAIFEKIKEGS